ncbi:unnamed protein product [Ostreobium quekettii]|uniref:F-box domain-containing protein n=1 Tax=Ostreobium quekettii TaxID=121088 RepID=A0A8S1IST6_9CHLO|nr:unnamed protein product [Ostreobium quekettii]
MMLRSELVNRLSGAAAGTNLLAVCRGLSSPAPRQSRGALVPIQPPVHPRIGDCRSSVRHLEAHRVNPRDEMGEGGWRRVVVRKVAGCGDAAPRRNPVAGCMPDAVLAKIFSLVPFGQRLLVLPLVCKNWARVMQTEPAVWRSCSLDATNWRGHHEGEMDADHVVDWFARRPAQMERLFIDFAGFELPVLGLLLGMMSKTLMMVRLKNGTFSIEHSLGIRCAQRLRYLSLQLKGDAQWGAIRSLSALRQLSILEVSFVEQPRLGSANVRMSSIEENNVFSFPQYFEELRLTNWGHVGLDLPEGVFCNWGDLRVLDLQHTTVPYLPEAVSKLMRLEELKVTVYKGYVRSNNLLPAIFVSLTALPALKSLYIGSDVCQFRFCSMIFKMTQLESLEFEGFSFIQPVSCEEEDVELVDLIEALNHLPSLTHFGLQKCRLHFCPLSFRGVCGLRSLNLARNSLSEHNKAMPSGAWLSTLTAMDLSDNRLDRIPKALREATALVELDLSWNVFEINDEDVDLILGMKHLRKLVLGGEERTWGRQSVHSLMRLARIDPNLLVVV